MRNIDEAGYTMAKSAVVTLTRSFGQKGRNGPWKKDGIKGQLISKELFDVIVSTKKTTIFLRISVLASKNSSNQKTLLYNYVK